VVASLALFVGYAWFTRALVEDIREDTERLAVLYARALRVTSPEDAQLLLFEEVIQNFPYPVILTDELGNPTAFKNLDLQITSQTGPWGPAERIALRQEAARMDRISDPYPVLDESGAVIQRIHVAEAGTVTLLRYLPYIQALGLAAIGLIAFWLIRHNLRAQRGQIWVAMARESAHQLGTPISSLYGWVELLKGEADTTAALTAMGQDLDRLTKVANRFELIGRNPQLAPLDLHGVVRDLEEYYGARLPRRGRTIGLTTDYEPVPRVEANRTLLEWALENLVKNAVDALEATGGEIVLRVARGVTPGTVIVEVSDDGPGVPWSLRKQIFETGVSTKPHGWGVGLSLAKRIVEENHGGSLELVTAEPGVGTTFRVTLAASEDEA
jgi:signal transduction histidine kinase